MKNKTLGNTLIIVGTMIGAGIRYKMAQNAFFCTKKSKVIYLALLIWWR